MSGVTRRLVAAASPALILLNVAALSGAAEDRGARKYTKEGQNTDHAIYQALKSVINTGSDLYNQSGDAAGCFRLYQGGLLALRPLLGHHPEMQKAIDTVLVDVEQMPTVRQRAFALNRVLRDIRGQLKPPGKGRGEQAAPGP
jgi:hypothetical protein